MNPGHSKDEHIIKTSLKEFQKLKALADKALAQVSDEEYFKTPTPESNSLAIIVKHMAGNMKSRWTDFLTTDGEKSERKRDQEFVAGEADSRESLTRAWESGWETVFQTLEKLPPNSLLAEVTIRGQKLTVFEAISRQLTHYGNHVGQIVFLAKQLRDSDWRTLSIPRGQSEEFNKKMGL